MYLPTTEYQQAALLFIPIFYTYIKTSKIFQKQNLKMSTNGKFHAKKRHRVKASKNIDAAKKTAFKTLKGLVYRGRKHLALR